MSPRHERKFLLRPTWYKHWHTGVLKSLTVAGEGTLVVFASLGSLICFWTVCIVCMNRIRTMQLFHRTTLLFPRSVQGPRNNSLGLCLFFLGSAWDLFLSVTDLCEMGCEVYSGEGRYRSSSYAKTSSAWHAWWWDSFWLGKKSLLVLTPSPPYLS